MGAELLHRAEPDADHGGEVRIGSGGPREFGVGEAVGELELHSIRRRRRRRFPLGEELSQESLRGGDSPKCRLRCWRSLMSRNTRRCRELLWRVLAGCVREGEVLSKGVWRC